MNVNSRERVKKTILHQEPDRIPLDIGGCRVTGIHIEAYRTFRTTYGLSALKPEVLVRYLQLAKIDQDFRTLLKIDLESIDADNQAEDEPVQKIENNNYYRDRWGCGWYMPENSAYFDLNDFPLSGPEILEVEEINKFQLPNPTSEILLRDFTGSAREINHQRQRAIILSRDCPGIYETASFLRGHEKMLLDLSLKTASAEALLDRVLEYKLSYWQEAIKHTFSKAVQWEITTNNPTKIVTLLRAKNKMVRFLEKWISKNS